MKDRDLRDYINDLVEACEDILSFTRNMSYSDFAQDKKTVNAVVRSLEVIGEATKNLPDSFRLEHPKIPWKQMVWQVVEKHITEILPLLQEIHTGGDAAAGPTISPGKGKADSLYEQPQAQELELRYSDHEC